MSISVRYPYSLNLSRLVPIAFFIAITILSFAAFRVPVAAVMGLGAVILLAVGMRFPLLTVYVYAASTFLAYVPLGGTIALPSVTGALFLVAAGTEVLLGKRSTAIQSVRQSSWISRWVLLFWITVCISALVNPREFLANPRGLATYAALVVTVPAVVFLLRTDLSIVRISQVFVFGATAAAILTCYQFLTGSYNTFEFFHSFPPSERAYGFADPNYTSATLDTLFPLLLALLLTTKRFLTKALMTGALFLMLVAVGMTASRGGFLGMILAGAVCLLIVSPTRVRWSASSVAKRAGIALFFLGIFGVALTVSPANLWERVLTMTDEEKVGNEGRLTVWSDYMQDIQERPWFGYGPGYMSPEAEDERSVIQHSTPLEFLTEIGGVGLFAFLGLSFSVLYELWRARRKFQFSGDGQMAAISAALIAGFVAFHFTGLFLNRGNDKQLWVLFGMAAAVVSLANHREHTIKIEALEYPGGAPPWH